MNPEAAQPVSDDEKLARFVFSKRHIRRPDMTVRPEVFRPRPGEGLSVIRHDDLGESGLWTLGRIMERGRRDSLHGRSDVLARVFVKNGLEAAAAPNQMTPHHAEIRGWPSDRSACMLIAQKVAAEASSVLAVPTGQREGSRDNGDSGSASTSPALALPAHRRRHPQHHPPDGGD